MEYGKHTQGGGAESRAPQTHRKGGRAARRAALASAAGMALFLAALFLAALGADDDPTPAWWMTKAAALAALALAGLVTWAGRKDE